MAQNFINLEIIENTKTRRIRKNTKKDSTNIKDWKQIYFRWIALFSHIHTFHIPSITHHFCGIVNNKSVGTLKSHVYFQCYQNRRYSNLFTIQSIWTKKALFFVFSEYYLLVLILRYIPTLHHCYKKSSYLIYIYLFSIVLWT